ncbi:FkbM family methyltransferase [Streptomyces sp. TRM68367]|uniref:FkbM family methyltransferase n=1 Tax=Streptomyces sp. TRM68367 TaxID=2758415 RepID=UPI00165ABFAF|nr:FkbM family methyltransferase [Streptomyces sp. TRM68367]MBC9726977.1 FkbM family methyltransferase [Streptomyces sp. TRM68367]
MPSEDILSSTRDLFIRVPGCQRALRAAALRGLVPRAVWGRLHPTGEWSLRAPDGRTFRYVSSDADILARSLIWTNMRHWEETTHPLVYQLARNARRFVDIGAFSGIYTLLACRANPHLEAVAVEPNPVAARMLNRNVRANRLESRVTIIDKALSDTPGRTCLRIPADTTAASLLDRRTARSLVDVEVTTGDEVLDRLAVDLIKVDVEGLEPQVLRGMEKSIRAHHPAIIAECLDKAALSRLRETAFDLGYRHIQHLGSRGPAPVTADLVPPGRYANFLITRDSAAARRSGSTS